MALSADDKYLWDKAAALNKVATADLGYNPGNVAAGQWNASNVKEAFGSAGLTPEQHYQKYGYGEGLSYEQPKTADLFQPNLVPSSSSTSSSTSGLPTTFTGPLLEGLLPALQASIKDLPGQVDQWTDKNLAASRSASKNLLDGHLTSILADLAKRGVTGSSVASDAVSSAAVDAAKNQASTDLGISGQGNLMKLQIPTTLAGVAGLGQQSTSTSSSQQSNPLAPYELYSQMLLGMM